ncbi:MAG: DinB family protein [Ferruginibacter sp.]
MERREIITLLTENHSSFIEYINGLTNEEFSFSPLQKWTAGQQLDHIYLSVKPVTLILSFPRIFIRLVFGKANRPGRTYEELVKKYLNKLENGGKATRPFIPKAIALNQKETIIKALTKNIKVLCSKIEKFTEKDLDTLILPHPLLGKLTIREMLYFTVFHVEHHHEITKRNLSASN